MEQRKNVGASWAGAPTNDDFLNGGRGVSVVLSYDTTKSSGFQALDAGTPTRGQAVEVRRR